MYSLSSARAPASTDALHQNEMELSLISNRASAASVHPSRGPSGAGAPCFRGSTDSALVTCGSSIVHTAGEIDTMPSIASGVPQQQQQQQQLLLLQRPQSRRSAGRTAHGETPVKNDSAFYKVLPPQQKSCQQQQQQQELCL